MCFYSRGIRSILHKFEKARKQLEISFLCCNETLTGLFDGSTHLFRGHNHQYFLPNVMDMGSLLGTIFGTILNYKRILMSTVKGPLIRLILTVAHIGLGPLRVRSQDQSTRLLGCRVRDVGLGV